MTVKDELGNEIYSNYVVHPGDILTDEIEFIGLTPRKLAERMDRDVEQVCDLLACKIPVNYEIAVDLDRVLGIPAYMWMRHQNAYDQSIWRIQGRMGGGED